LGNESIAYGGSLRTSLTGIPLPFGFGWFSAEGSKALKMRVSSPKTRLTQKSAKKNSRTPKIPAEQAGRSGIRRAWRTYLTLFTGYGAAAEHCAARVVRGKVLSRLLNFIFGSG